MSPSTCSPLAILALLATLAPCRAQVDALRDALRAGDLARAVAALDKPMRIDDATERLDLTEQLRGLTRNEDDPALRTAALRHCTSLLEPSVPSRDEARRRELSAAVGRAFAAELGGAGADPDAPGYVQDVLGAFSAINAAGTVSDRVVVDLALRALPALVELRRYRPAIALGEQALEGPAREHERAELSAQIGVALLGLRRAEQAIPYLDVAIAADPTDPLAVLRIVERLPKSLADDAYRFLLPVVRTRPSDAVASAWQECVGETYAALDSLGRKTEPGTGYWKDLIVARPMPKVWNTVIWSNGYRVWMPDGARAGKQYEGRHAIEAALPISFGWRRIPTPPGELRRWRNAAICFARTGSDTVLTIYWFGPNLHYWYGYTPRARGVTGTAARGQVRGGIARLVQDVVYREDAKRRKVKFKPHAPLPVQFGVRGIRKAYERDGVIYDETFFSVGQVTCEVLLRIDEGEFERLEPEIRWLCRNVRAN